MNNATRILEKIGQEWIEEQRSQLFFRKRIIVYPSWYKNPLGKLFVISVCEIAFVAWQSISGKDISIELSRLLQLI
jgi:hypothetical protein